MVRLTRTPKTAGDASAQTRLSKMPRPIPEDAPSIKECSALAKERRTRIINDLVDYFTGDRIESAELAHFRTIAHFFGIDRIVKDVCIANAESGDELIVELMVSAALVALERAIRYPYISH